MKSNYINAESVIKAVLLKAETKTFDVTIKIDGKTFLVGATTKSSDELIENFDFSRLPNDLTDEQLDDIADKVMEAVSGFPTDGTAKHYDQEELKKFYQGLAFFDYALKEPSQTKTELKETTLRMILKKVDASDLELFKWYLSLKEPTLSDISMAIEQLNDYKH